MNDITDRLRRWSISAQAAPASDLMDEAADEIEQLRSSCAAAVQRLAYETGRLRLTDAERGVIEAILIDPDFAPADSAATLRGLLERMK